MPVKKSKPQSLAEQYGLRTISKLDEVQFISSGIPEIDTLTGGIPKARITEIYGTTGAGKTSLTLKCVSGLSKNGKVLFIDAENAINPSFLTDDANTDNIVISNESNLETVAELTVEAVKEFDAIVIDSVASLLPRVEQDGEMGDQNIGIKARLMGKWMRKLVAPLGKSNCAFLFINQLRESPSMYVPKYTPGGKALPYAASLRIELSSNKADRIIKDGLTVAHRVKVEVTKSKISQPHLSTSFVLKYT